MEGKVGAFQPKAGRKQLNRAFGIRLKAAKFPKSIDGIHVFVARMRSVHCFFFSDKISPYDFLGNWLRIPSLPKNRRTASPINPPSLRSSAKNHMASRDDAILAVVLRTTLRKDGCNSQRGPIAATVPARAIMQQGQTTAVNQLRNAIPNKWRPHSTRPKEVMPMVIMKAMPMLVGG